MKLKTATLIAIVGLVLNLLYVIGNWMFMARAHGAASLQGQWLVSPILFHGSLLVFLVVLYRKQVDHNTSPETVTPAVEPDKPLPVATTVKPDKPPSAATAIQPGFIVYAASSTFFVLGATALFGVFLALCDCNFNHWAELGECHMVPSLGGTAVILWVVSLVLGLITARHRPSVWWWTGPLVAIALAAIIGLPARYFWLEHQNKANQANAPTAVPVSPVEPAPAPTVDPVAPIPPVETTPASTNRPLKTGFAGQWRAEFTFEKNTGHPSEPRHPWMVCDLTMTQSGNAVTGVMQGGVGGNISGKVTARAFRGTMRLSWDQHDWDSLSLDLSEDGWTGKGKAIFGASDTEKHYYSIVLTRL